MNNPHFDSDVPLPGMTAGECGATLVRFICYGLLFFLYVEGIMWDASRQVADNLKFSEVSFTEFSQSVLLAGSIFLFLVVRKRYHSYTVASLALAMFLLVSLLRENDAWLDLIHHGVWVYPALLVAIPTLGYVVMKWRLLLKELCQLMTTRAFALLLAGFLTVYVYSRLLGRSLLWQAAMGEHYVRIAKNMGEECTESLGYLLIFCAAIELLMTSRAIYRRRLQSARPA